ncbi:hypothetical protein D7Z54_18805 [Salibacterium salarium]|uniref:Lipoprotein n=1 Tax=Salibacterium salarium TaxID=284579 RepID=A0A3R9Q1W4_9BACI|nr:DUF6612 family protein [Salibacterium salarium]RSL31847.1 hypothetical protein D7Z54_18805 [Salibacterium salarium]
MKKIKKIALVMTGASTLLMSACGDRELPEEIYADAMTAMEDLDSVYFTYSNTLNAEEDGVSTFTRGALQYDDPLQGYLETNLNVIDISDPVEMDLRVDGNNIEIREGEEWEPHDTNREEMSTMLRPEEELSFFLPFEKEFLMKEVTDMEETDDYYEVSFKGTDERHYSLVEKKLKDLGVSSSSSDGLTDEQLDSLQLDGIEMTAFIDQETKRLNGYDTRFRFTIEIGGELQSFDEITSVRYQDHNEVDGNLESYMEEKLKEIQQEQMEEQKSEENNS